jgi:hypothetical protein
MLRVAIDCLYFLSIAQLGTGYYTDNIHCTLRLRSKTLAAFTSITALCATQRGVDPTLQWTGAIEFLCTLTVLEEMKSKGISDEEAADSTGNRDLREGVTAGMLPLIPGRALLYVIDYQDLDRLFARLKI